MMAGLHTEGRELDDGDYIAKKVGTVKMTTCASPAYLDQHGTPETMDELQQHQAVNWINSSNRQVMPRTFRTSEGSTEIELPGRLVVDNSEAYIAAGGGAGNTTGHEYFLQPYLERGLLVEVLPDNPSPNRKLSLLYPHRHLPKSTGVYRLAGKFIVNARGLQPAGTCAAFIGPPASVWLHGQEHRQTSAQ